MKISVLGSGSKGNSTFITDGEFSLIVDAGFSGRELDKRLSEIGHSLKEINAILITHDHGDHINGAGVVARNTQAPVYANLKMHYKLKRRLGKKVKFVDIKMNEPFKLGNFSITPFDTPHDAIHSNGFIVDHNDIKVGIATDIGYPRENIIKALRQCDTLILESNHDLHMLATGPYPKILQDRVRGNNGHLSNCQTAEILKAVVHKELKRVIFVHLSEENNKESLVIESAQEALNGFNTEIIISSQHSPTLLYTI